MTYRSEDSGSSPLQAGLYTVSQTCRVLRPSMTPRKVHYWLDTNLLGDPIRWGRPGVPTILSFEQVLKIRTLQHLRDTLRFTLQEVRKGLAWLLEALVHDQWHSLSFFRVGTGNIGVTDGEQSFAIPGGQGILSPALPEALTHHIERARFDWERKAMEIAGYPHLVSSARILGGSPIIRGTRIETAFVAHLASDLPLDELSTLFPAVDVEALREAVRFEGFNHAG